MEIAIVLIVLLVLFAIWLAPLALAIAINAGLRRDMRTLRRRIVTLEKGPVSPTTAQPYPEPEPEPEFEELELERERDLEPELEVEPQVPLAPTPLPPKRIYPTLPDVSPERLAVWIAASLGGIALVLTALFALVAVVERGWLGPPARISIGLVAGTLLWAVGARRHAHQPWTASALSGAGAATLYGSLYAGSGLYHLFSDSVASALMIAVTAVATLRAARKGERFMAHIALIGGLLTPVLVSTGTNRPVAFFSYLALLAAGVVAAAAYRRWWDVIAVAAVGTGLLHIMWTATWYAADQAPYGLLGAAMLALPFAAASASHDKSVYSASAIGGVALSCLSIPWLIPVDPVFYDPRSGEMIVRASLTATMWAAIAVAALPIPLWLAGRRQRHEAAGVPGAIVATALPVAFAIGWALLEHPPSQWLALGAVASAITGTLFTLGSDRSARAMLPVPLAAGFALFLGVATGAIAGEHYGPATCALVIVGLLVARSGGWGWMLPPVLLGVSLPLMASAHRVADLGLTWSLAPILVTAALLSQVPLVVRWDRSPRVPAAVAAITGPMLLWPLHAIWKAGLGDSILGLVPLLVAGNALLAATVLLRKRQVGRDDWLLALYVGVVLFGLSAAMPIQLQESHLTVAWAIEAAALAGISHRVTNPLLRWFSLALCAIVGVRLLANPWALAWGDAAGWPILNWTLFSWGVPMVCVALVALWLPRRDDSKDPLRWAPGPLIVLSLLIGFALVNVQVSHGFQDAGPIELGGKSVYQGMVRSITWALYGLSILLAGLFANVRALRFVGFAFVLVAAGKVFGFDLWGMSGFIRVGSIGALGVTLITAAFLFERLVVRGFREETPTLTEAIA